jgi:hypothetical protein
VFDRQGLEEDKDVYWAKKEMLWNSVEEYERAAREVERL